MRDGVFVCRGPVLPTTVMEKTKPALSHGNREAAHILRSRISKAETSSSGGLPGYTKKVLNGKGRIKLIKFIGCINNFEPEGSVKWPIRLHRPESQVLGHPPPTIHKR